MCGYAVLGGLYVWVMRVCLWECAGVLRACGWVGKAYVWAGRSCVCGCLCGVWVTRVCVCFTN